MFFNWWAKIDRASILGFPVPDRSKQCDEDASKDNDDDNILNYTSKADSNYIREELPSNRSLLRESCSLRISILKSYPRSIKKRYGYCFHWSSLNFMQFCISRKIAFRSKEDNYDVEC